MPRRERREQRCFRLVRPLAVAVGCEPDRRHRRIGRFAEPQPHRGCGRAVDWNVERRHHDSLLQALPCA
jgi:hypothetical protein